MSIFVGRKRDGSDSQHGDRTVRLAACIWVAQEEAVL